MRALYHPAKRRKIYVNKYSHTEKKLKVRNFVYDSLFRNNNGDRVPDFILFYKV